jgi:hypothetical protein
MFTFFFIFFAALGALLAVQAMDVECANPPSMPRATRLARPLPFNLLTSSQ